MLAYGPLKFRAYCAQDSEYFDAACASSKIGTSTSLTVPLGLSRNWEDTGNDAAS